MNNYILEYYQGIKDGSIIVGKWVRLWYEYLVTGLQEKRFTYSARHARAAILFIEAFMHHSEGALAPGLLKLELWQKAIVSTIFGILDKNGYRQWRECIIICGRKNGKSLFMSAISEFFAYCDDYGGQIFYASPKLQQAQICFNNFWQAVQHEPELNARARKRRTDIYIADRNTTVQPLAFNARKSDGFNVNLCIADEISSWPGANGIKFYEVIRSSFGARRQPLLLSISTASYENGGIYDELIKRGTRVLLGGSRETRLAPILYMIDNIEKWNDINELQKANPNLGVSVSVDYMIEEIAIAEESLTKKAEFLAKYCNIKQNSTQAWLTTKDVERCSSDEEFTPEMFRSSYCVVGVDLSQSVDLTAVTAIIEKNGELYVLAKFFLPAEKINDAIARDGLPYDIYVKRGLLQLSGENYVDYADCYKWITDLVEKYEIYPLKVGYDRYCALQFKQMCEQYGLHMDSVFQGENLTPCIRQLEGIIKDGKLHIGNNDLLKIHFLNSALKANSESARVKLIKLNATAHIDGMAAVLDAITVRQKWYGDIGEQLKNE